MYTMCTHPPTYAHAQAGTQTYLEKFRDIRDLRNAILRIAAVFLEQGQQTIEFLASMLLVQRKDPIVNSAPRFDLTFCVLNVRNLLAQREV